MRSCQDFSKVNYIYWQYNSSSQNFLCTITVSNQNITLSWQPMYRATIMTKVHLMVENIQSHQNQGNHGRVEQFKMS